MVRFKITVRAQGFSVQVNFHQDRKILTDFCSQLDVYETRYNPKLKKATRVYKMTFATFIPKTVTYGLHRNLYKPFLEHLQHSRVAENEVEIELKEPHRGKRVFIQLSEIAKPKEKQLPIIKWITDAELVKAITDPETIKVLAAQTGFGKTFCALYSIAVIGVRTAICMSAMHVETWLKDAKWIYENSDKEIKVIRGKKDFRKAIIAAKKKTLEESVLIFTVATIRDYLSEYERDGKSSYGCAPGDLYKVLKVGFRIVDESHENLHFNFRHTIETNVDKILYLSATLESNDAFINKMYGVIYPITQRYKGLEWNKYAAVLALGYNIREPQRIRCTGSMGYSHNQFEQSLIAHKVILANYMSMIYKIADKYYIERYAAGQKLLIYMSSIDMCAKMADYIRRIVGNRFTCSAYTGEHLDEVLHTNDIVVSTPGKSGTGKDIKGLVVVISTVAMAAKEKNTQMLGRLRPIDELYPGRDPLFIYLVAMNQPKHMDYHRMKVEQFTPLVKTLHTQRTAFIV